MNAISRYLIERGYIKMNPYLYMKNIKSNVVTGDTVLVDLRKETVDVITICDKFLCFDRKPTVKVIPRHYSSLLEFRRFIQGNEKREVEFIKKDMDWGRRKRNG